MSNQRIKVAHIIGNVSEGGVEMMIMNLFRNIDRTQVEFHFYVYNTSVVINKDEIEKLGGKVFIIPSIKHYFKFNHSLKNYFLENDYDIAHASMNALSFIPLKIAKKCNVKVRISHSHSTSNKKEFLRHIIKNLLRPYSRKYATHYFACSEKAGRWLFGNKLYDENKVHLINNAIDIDKFSFNEETRKRIRKQLDIKGNIKVVGHIGRFVKQKNHEYLVRIYEELKKIDNDTALLLAGSGDKEEKIKNIVSSKKLDNVIFIGPVENPSDYYQAMDIFVLPSLYEGLPVVGVEAQVNGLKCLFSNEITKEAMLIPETEYISIKENPSIWANKIEDYFKNKKEYRLKSDISSKYDIKNIASNMLDLYKEFLSSKE